MKLGSTLFLKAVVVLIGALVLAICTFVLPSAILFERTGMYLPLLLGLYIPAFPFFFALYQSIKLLNLIDKNKAFSNLSVKAFQNIKYCAVAISGMFTVGMPYIYYVAEIDDAPGAILMGLVIIFTSSVIATFAGVLQQLLQNAVEIKSENDLTV